MSFSQISQSKTKHLLGSIVDLSKENEDYDYDERDGHDRANGTNGTLGQSRMDRRYLQLQARSFRDFENLFVALDALERWKDAADRMMRCVCFLSIIGRLLLTAICEQSGHGKAWSCQNFE